MRYQVKIIESIAMTVEMEAQSEEEALEQVREKYRGEEIIVECSGRPEVEFFVSPIE